MLHIPDLPPPILVPTFYIPPWASGRHKPCAESLGSLASGFGRSAQGSAMPLASFLRAAVRGLPSFPKAIAPARQPCPHGFLLASPHTCFPHLFRSRRGTAPLAAGSGGLTIPGGGVLFKPAHTFVNSPSPATLHSPHLSKPAASCWDLKKLHCLTSGSIVMRTIQKEIVGLWGQRGDGAGK